MAARKHAPADATGPEDDHEAEPVVVDAASGAAVPPATEAFQAAALQMISAAKAMLEAAEQAVQDPQVLNQMATTFGAVAKGVLGTLGSLRPPSGDGHGTSANPPIEHIDLD